MLNSSAHKATNTGIADRIYGCFPSGTYCLPALLRVLEVVETTSVETAAIECKALPRLLINPEFVAKHAASSEKLLMLVLHELHHLLLGHTRLYPRPTALDNLAFDAVINATLSQLFPVPEYLSMFTDFYDEGDLFACFLRPPRGWRPKETFVAPTALQGDGEDLRYLREVYAALYSEKGATYNEVRDALGRALWMTKDRTQPGTPEEELPPLLGDHSNESTTPSSSSGNLETRAPALLSAVREIVERWPQPPTPIVGRSIDEFLKAKGVQPARTSPSAKLRRLMYLIADQGGSRGSPHPTATPLSVSSAVPRSTRRGVVLRALGANPMLHEHNIEQRRMLSVSERVHVYLDVSGSVEQMIPMLYGVILASRNYVHPVVHTFSTTVADITLKQLARGKVKTTGGTSIDCVADHIRKNGVRRAVLITDGYVGFPNEADRNTLGAVKLGVALTPGGTTERDLQGMVNRWTKLER